MVCPGCGLAGWAFTAPRDARACWEVVAQSIDHAPTPHGFSRCSECLAIVRDGVARCPACGAWMMDPDADAWADYPDPVTPDQ